MLAVARAVPNRIHEPGETPRRKDLRAAFLKEPDRLAGRDVAPRLVEDDEAVARDHRGEDPRALRPGRPHLPAPVVDLEDPALELAPAPLLRHRLDRLRLVHVVE